MHPLQTEILPKKIWVSSEKHAAIVVFLFIYFLPVEKLKEKYKKFLGDGGKGGGGMNSFIFIIFISRNNF